MAKKNTKSRYWVDDNSILPEIIITPQGNYPVLDEAGNPARTVGAIQDINPNAHIYERVNTQPFMDDYIEGETNATANQRADALDATVVPHIGDFVGAAFNPFAPYRLSEVRRRLYDHVNPYSYGLPIIRTLGAISNPSRVDTIQVKAYKDRRGATRYSDLNSLLRDDIFAEYLQIPKSERHKIILPSGIENTVYESGEIVPTNLRPKNADNAPHYKLKNLSPYYKEQLVKEGTSIPVNFNITSRLLQPYFGDHTIGHGYDNQGEYVSYYDKWDLAPFTLNGEDQSMGIGKPVLLYDRTYLDDYYQTPYPTHATYLPEVEVTPNSYSQGGSLKSASWNDLSMREKADIIKVGVKHGLNRLDDIKSKYNEFAEGGNIYSGTGAHSQQMNQQVKQEYIYDILPQLYAMDGVNVRVSSGLRPNTVVYQNGRPTNRPSRHGMGQAVDIVPGEGATFNDIFRVLNNPNSNVSRWMRANGAGFIDETSATGTTKYWHDYKKDHSHVHHQIGGSPARQYAARFNVQQRPVNKAWERRAASYWPKAQAMYQELLSAGVNPVAAAGILGNIAQESEFNPNAANSINGGHWGYLQNDKNITPWVRANYGGYDHRSQMNYLIAGLQGKLPKSNMGLDRRFNGFNARMQGVTDPEMAAYLWEREYEKSANEGVPQRKYFARYFYDRMMGNNGIVQQQYSQPVVMPQNPYPMPMPTVDYQKLAMQQMEMLQRDQEERARQAEYLAEKEQREAERNRQMGMLNLVMSMGAPEESNDNFFNSMLGLAMSNNAKKEETDYSSFNPFSLTV